MLKDQEKHESCLLSYPSVCCDSRFIFDGLNNKRHTPADDTYKNLLNGKSVQRIEFQNASATLDLLVMPLQIEKNRIGAIVLLS